MRIGGGSKGKSFSDRELAGEVRNLGLKHLKKVLESINLDGFEATLTDFQAQVLLRLAPNLLPRLNEHTGADGKDLPTPILNVVPSDYSDQEDPTPQEED